jgi:hypothetical protein
MSLFTFLLVDAFAMRSCRKQAVHTKITQKRAATLSGGPVAVSPPQDKGRHDIEEDVGNIDDGIRLLARIECVSQARVDSDDIMDIPEHLFDEASAALLRYNIPQAQWTDPHLRIFINTDKGAY